MLQHSIAPDDIERIIFKRYLINICCQEVNVKISAYTSVMCHLKTHIRYIESGHIEPAHRQGDCIFSAPAASIQQTSLIEGFKHVKGIMPLPDTAFIFIVPCFYVLVHVNQPF